MKLKSNHQLPARLLGVVITLFALTPFTHAQNGTWTNLVSGSWTAATNWNAGTPAFGSGNTADFSTLTLGSSPIVTLDGARTIGNLIFGDVGNTYNWTLNTGSGGPLTLAGGSPTITVNNGTIVTNSVLFAGTAGLTKTGNGTLILSTSQNGGYSGGTTVNGGTLKLGTGGGTGNINGTLTINNGATVTATAGNSLGYNGGSQQVSTLNIYNGSTFNTTVSGDQGWGLTVNLMGGTMASGSGDFSMGNGYNINTIATNVTSTVSGTINTRNSQPNNQLVFTVAAGTATPDLLVSALINNTQSGDGVTKNGAGVMSLTAANTYNGTTYVNAGKLQLSGSGGSGGTLSASPIYVASGAELDLNTSDALGYGNGNAITIAGTLNKINNQAETMYRPLTLTNGVITNTLTAAQQAYETFGGYIVTAPNTTNWITGAGQFGLRTSTCYITNAPGSVLNISAVIYPYTSGCPLNKMGAGKMVLLATNIYNGNTVINGGTLEVDGTTGTGAVSVGNGAVLDGFGTVLGATTVQSGGTILVGTNAATGTLSISNALTLNSGGTNIMRINKTGATLTGDLLQGMTSVGYGGTLTVTATGDALAAGDTFQLFNATTHSGGFDNYNLPALTTGLTWDKSQLLVNGTIRVISGSTPPSFNPPGGGYVGAQSVTISSDAGSTIYYTTDGSDPTTSGTAISGASPITGIIIPVGTTETLMAYATNTISHASASPVESATYVVDATGIWTNLAGGTWAVPANWTNAAVPNGSGLTADFSTLTLASNTTVTVGSAKTVGTLLFEDQNNQYGWLFGGSGPLTMDAGAAVPSIVVSNQSVNISVPIAGTNGLTISGAGSPAPGVTMSSASSSFTGNLTLSGISVTNTTAAGATTSDLGAKVGGRTITINSDAVLNFTLNNVFGGGGMTNTSLPTLVINGLMYSTRYNAMPNIVLNGGTLDQNASDGGNYQGYQFLGSVTVGGSTNSTISTDDGKTDDLLGSGTTFNVAVTGATGPDLIVSAPLANASSDYGASVASLIKTGAGTMLLSGASTYTGATIVSNGTLQVDVAGSIANGSVMVAGGTLEVDGSTTGSGGAIAVNGGALDGTGYTFDAVTVNGGTLSAGTASGKGTFSIYNTLSMSAGGTVVLRIDKTGGSLSSDLIAGITTLHYGGTLTVTNVTSDTNVLAAGDSFQIFSAGTYSGVVTNLNLPALPAGLFWDTSGLTHGSIAVTANAPTPVFNPTPGGYVGTVSVTISSESGSEIYYTTDGSYPPSPTMMSNVSPATVVIPANTPSETIYAYASVPAGDSYVAYATYSTVDTPTWISPYDGVWSGSYNWSNNVVANGVDATADFSTLTLSADTTVTLDTPITVGNMIFGDQGNAYNWILADGGAGPLTLAASSGSPTITVNNSTNIVTAVLTGTSGMVKAGAGMLVLTNFETYTGNTVVNAGNLTLAVGGASGTLSSSTLTVNNGASVTATAGNALGYSGSAWVTTLNLYGSTFTNTFSNDQGWQLTANLMGGTMASGPGDFALGGPTGGTGSAINTIATNVTSVISGTINTRENNPSNQIPFNVAAGTASPDLLVSAVINNYHAGVGITKTGAGVMSLTAAETFSGPTIVSNGVLQLSGNGGSLGTLQNSAVTVYGPGELQVNTADALGYTYSATRTLALMGGTLREINTNSETLGRPITMSNANITANFGAGATTPVGVVGDCYNLFNATAIITTLPATTNYISLPAGCQFALRGGSFTNAAGSVLIVNGVLDGWNGGTYPLIKDGPGSMILNSNNTYAGSTYITNGTLEVDGSISNGAVAIIGGILDGTGTINGPIVVASGGTLMAGTFASMGTLSIGNGLALSSGSTNVMRINKAGATLTSDLLQGMTSLNYGGTLEVTATGDALVAGDTFHLFNSLAYSGIFTSYSFPALTAGLSWDTSQLLVNGTISVTAGTPGTATPAFNPPGGNYVGAQSVTINSDVGSTIFYTTDGSNPTTSGTRISGISPVGGIVIPVNTTETLKAFATNSGTADSAVASATYSTTSAGIWTNNLGGTWATTANWTNGAVPNGSGITADFSTLTLTSNTTVTLASPKTAGTLLFEDQGNAHGWILNGGGPLTMDAGVTVPSIVVSNQSVTFFTPIAGTNGLIKTGAGTLVLTNFETYTGNTVVNAGNLTLGANNANVGTLSSGTLTVNPGASVTATIANALGYNGGTEWVTNLNLYGSTFTTSIGSTNVGDQGWGLTVNMMGGTLASVGTNSEFSVGGGWAINTLATNVPSTISGTMRTRNGQPNNQIPFNVAAGSASPDLLVSAVINNFDTNFNVVDYIVKTGAGVMRLTATNTYDGATIVSNGTLEVDGSIAGGGVTVNGGVLDGNGSIGGGVTVNAGGTLSAGTAAGIGTLTINSPLFLSGGTAAMRINKTGGVLTNDNVQGLTGVTYYGGTLTVTATGDALAAGDKFTLFASSSYNSSLSATNLPALASGLAWDASKLAVDGSIEVIASVNTTPTNITATVSGNTLSLSWPADHTGWRLLVQTNNLAAGISSNTNDWMTLSGSAGINQTNITIDPAKPTEFYRLVYP